MTALKSLTFAEFADLYATYTEASCVDGLYELSSNRHPVNFLKHLGAHHVEIKADGLTGWGDNTVFATVYFEDGERLVNCMAAPR